MSCANGRGAMDDVWRWSAEGTGCRVVLDVPTKLQRRRDLAETLFRSSGTGDNDCPEAEQPPGQSLVNSDAFDLMKE